MKDFHRVRQHLENMWKHCKTLTQTKCKKSIEILKPYQNKNTGDIIYSHRCCQQQVVPPASFLVSSRQVTARNKSRIHLIHSYARRWGLKQCAAPSHKSKFCNFLEMIWLRKKRQLFIPQWYTVYLQDVMCLLIMALFLRFSMVFHQTWHGAWLFNEHYTRDVDPN